MSIEFEPIHVRPMTDIPTGDFRYVKNGGMISCLYHAESFDPNMYEQVGWIPARATPKPPQPKEGEWWMCNIESSHIKKQVLFFESGHFRRGEGSDHYYSGAIPLYKMERAKE